MAATIEHVTELAMKLKLSKTATDTLTRRAAACGEELPDYVSKLVEHLAGPLTPLEELSGPIYQRFLESGTSNEELAEELEQAKHAMRAERRARTQS